MAAVRSHEQITGLSSVKSPTVPANMNAAHIQAQGQNVYVTTDGTTPSSTNGFVVRTTDAPFYVTIASGLEALKFLEVTASAVVNITYYGNDA